MDGFIVVDKPVGATSHDMVSLVRRVAQMKKVGHTGTLDPFATGVLPVALGEGTKAIQFLDESVKEYRAVMKLGSATDTQDHTGTVVKEGDWSGVTPEAVAALATRFTGTISQLPPMFSALKRDGVPLYKLARQGVEVEREERSVEIHSLTFENIALPLVAFTVRCSRGTYVRTLATDMGEALGCGAHLVELRRVRSGLFLETRSVSVEALKGAGDLSALLVPLDEALAHLKEFALSDDAAAKVRNGVAPRLESLCGVELAAGEQLRLSAQGKLLAVGQVDGDALRLMRVFH